MSSTIIKATDGSGHVGIGYSVDSWSTIRSASDGTENSDNTTINTVGSYNTGTYKGIYRGFISCPVNITDGDIITAATVQFYVEGKESSSTYNGYIYCVQASQASTSALENSDYDNRSSTVFGYAQVTGTGWFGISLNAAGLATVSDGGTSKFALISEYDYSNDSSNHNHVYYVTGPTGTNDLRLEVTHVTGSSSSSRSSSSSSSSSSSKRSSSSSSSSKSSSSSSSSSSRSSSSSSSSSCSGSPNYYLTKKHGAKPNILFDLTYDTLGSKLRVSQRPVVSSEMVTTPYSNKLLSVSGDIEHSVECWGGGMEVSGCSVSIANVTRGSVDTSITGIRDGYRMIGRRGEVKLHFDNTPISVTSTLYDGAVDSDDEELGSWNLSLNDGRSKYNLNIPKRLYTTTEFPNLQEGQENTVIPYLFGSKKNVVPTQIDILDQKYKVSDLPLYSLGSVYDSDGGVCLVRSSDLNTATFKLYKNAFTINEANSTSSLLYIDDNNLTTWVDNTGTASAIDPSPLTDPRYNTMDRLVTFINSKPGYTASLCCDGSIKSVRLELIADQEIHTSTYTAKLRKYDYGEIKCNAIGLKDRSTGKYTGTAGSRVKKPSDLIYYIMSSCCGMPDVYINTTSISNLRASQDGYDYGAFLDSQSSAFDVVQDISEQSYTWTYWDSIDNKLTILKADIDVDEVPVEYYYEKEPYARIIDGDIKKSRNTSNLYNKVDVLYNYDLMNSAYLNSISIESSASQSSVEGYGISRNLKIESDWIQDDLDAFYIEYTGTGVCSIEITGEGTDTEDRFKTYISEGGTGNEYDFDLSSASFDMLRKVTTKIDRDANYVCKLKSSVSGSLDSRGLRDTDVSSSVKIPTYVDKIGSYGSSTNQFEYPFDVAMDDNYIYVADEENDRIVRLTRNLVWSTTVGSRGSGNLQYKSPTSITTDGFNVYVADTGNSRIQRLNIGLTFSSHEGARDPTGWITGTGNGEFSYPYGICCNSNSIFIADTYNHRIQKFTKSTFTYSAKTGSYGTGDGQFKYPSAISCDKNYVYVTDSNNNRVQKFDTSLNFVSKIGTAGTGNDNFNIPGGIASDSSTLYIADSLNSRLVVRKVADLSYLSQVSSWGSGWENVFYMPHGVTASADTNDMYIADVGNHRIVKFNKAGKYVAKYSFAKLLARKMLMQNKDVHDEISFKTSLYGLRQRLGKIVYVRRIDETKDNRVRITKISKNLDDLSVKISGRSEGVVLSNIIGRWKMDQTTGANAIDYSGNNYTLTKSGSPTQIGGAIIRLDGVDDYFYRAHSATEKLDIKGNTGFSIVGKFKNRKTVSGSAQTIVSKWGTSGDNRQYRVYIFGYLLRFQVSSDGTSDTVSTALGSTYVTDSALIDSWFSFAAVYNTKYILLYVNGVLDEYSGFNPIAYSNGIYSSGTARFEIGSSISGTYLSTIDIDYIGMLDTALSQEEVMYIHEYWK